MGNYKTPKMIESLNDDSSHEVTYLVQLARQSAEARRNRVAAIYAANNGRANW